MRTKVRTIYVANDPDYATVILGYLSQTPLYAQLLNTAITDPIATDTVLLFEPPADINAADFVEVSVTATYGHTESDYIEKIFTFVQTKGFNFAGIVQAYVNATIDLDQVGNDGGAATITDILVELLKYDLEEETTTQLAYAVHTVNKSVAGHGTDNPYTEPSLSEPFIFNVGIDPPIQIGETAGFLLQMRVRVSFSVHSPAGQLVDSIAKCRLNCYRDQSKSTYLELAVV
jgi:hypothetical protein